MHIYVVRYRSKGTAFFWNMQTFWHIFRATASKFVILHKL